MNTFGVKNFMNRRKKEPSECESRKNTVNKDEIANDNFTASMNFSDTYMSISESNKVPFTSNTSHVYYIYLTESCCVEVSASQQNSTVKNILVQVIYQS